MATTRTLVMCENMRSHARREMEELLEVIEPAVKELRMGRYELVVGDHIVRFASVQEGPRCWRGYTINRIVWRCPAPTYRYYDEMQALVRP